MWHELPLQATSKLPVSSFKCLSVFSFEHVQEGRDRYLNNQNWKLISFTFLFKTAHSAHAPTEQFIYKNAYLKVWQYQQMLRHPGVISSHPLSSKCHVHVFILNTEKVKAWNSNASPTSTYHTAPCIIYEGDANYILPSAPLQVTAAILKARLHYDKVFL